MPKVPSTPSATIGAALRRKRRTPMFEPPSNRITTSASVVIRWTSSKLRTVPSRSTRSDAAAATTRSRPAVGTARRPATIRTPIASSSPPEAKRITWPKSRMSSTTTILHGRRGAGCRDDVPAPTYTFLTPVSPRTHASSRYFAGTHARRVSVCPRPRARGSGRVGGSDPGRDALDRERPRHGRAHRQGHRDRPARQGRREDRRPVAARPVEPAGQRRAAREDRVAARQGRQLLRARRALPDHGARRGVLDLRARPGQRDPRRQPGRCGRDRDVRRRRRQPVDDPGRPRRPCPFGPASETSSTKAVAP